MGSSRWLANWNGDPTPFIWKAPADIILDKVRRCKESSRTGDQAALTEYSYMVLFEPAEEGGYVVTCPALPGLVNEGDTIEEAGAMAEDAIRGYIESLGKDRQPIPADKTPEEQSVCWYP